MLTRQSLLKASNDESCVVCAFVRRRAGDGLPSTSRVVASAGFLLH
jgi:hypothetical protein